MISRSYSCNLCHTAGQPTGTDLIGIKWQTSNEDGKSHLVFCVNCRDVEHHLCQRCVKDIKRGEMARTP